MTIHRFLASLAVLALPLAASAATINIDFRDTTGRSDYNGITWNRVNAKSQITTPVELADSLNTATGITLTSSVDMQYTYDALQTFTGLPDAVAGNAVFGHDSDSTTPSFTFSGLDSNYTYTFSVYAIRRNRTDIASGLYTATGANTESGVVNASNNTSTILTLSNITPDSNGSISFSLMKDVTNNSQNATGTTTGYFYLNALTIESTLATIPEPGTSATLISLGALGCVLMRRRNIRQSAA